MIRKLQKADTDQVMQIWLNGNVEAHPFVPKDYWVSNYEMVREQLLEADVFVYEADKEVQGFIVLWILILPEYSWIKNTVRWVSESSF